MKGLLVVLSHPDDESMGTGGLVLRHTRAGVAVNLICATRGEKGWVGKPLGAREEDLADIRTAELEAAASALGIVGYELWDYPDGGVEGSDQAEITERIKQRIAALAPAVVVGWGPDGAYGHPDHVAMGRCTDMAVAAFEEERRPLLCHAAIDAALAKAYRSTIALDAEESGSLPLVVQERVDFVIELSPEEVQMKLRAIDCHQSQLQTWRVEVRHHLALMQQVYGREPYMVVSPKSSGLTTAGLLGELV